MRLVLSLAPRLNSGTLAITLPDGSLHRFQGTQPGPVAELTIHNDRVARRLLTGGSLGFCEAYLDGDWSSPDIETLFTVALENWTALERALNGRPWYRALQHLGHLLRPNSKRGSRRNIAYHYDLGNRFYEKWLDPSMTYSSAVYAEPAQPLEQAQKTKYAEIARRMALQPGQHVLEIGCGWGGFAEFAAGEVGAKVTAITISREQHAYASERLQKAGLNERAQVLLRDYRDVEGRYDRIASIEMFEAVGEKYWPTFFGTVRDRLTEGGRAAMQIITIADPYFDQYRRGADYIQKYIFPGGMLPSPEMLSRQVRAAGLRLCEMTGFGPHYAETLRDWNRRFQVAWPEIEAMGFDGRFKRMWEQYLAYCAAGFATGTIDVQQVALQRD